jgi:hypothetical protein
MGFTVSEVVPDVLDGDGPGEEALACAVLEEALGLAQEGLG